MNGKDGIRYFSLQRPGSQVSVSRVDRQTQDLRRRGVRRSLGGRRVLHRRLDRHDLTVVLARSNNYVVKASAPINTSPPPVIGTVTAPVTNVTKAILNPDALTGNDIFLACGTGHWNRDDLTFTYTWLFDRGNPSPAPQGLLGGLTYTGNGHENGILFKLAFAANGFSLLINGVPPSFSLPHDRVTYLDDYVQCQVTATTPSGKSSAPAFSRSVHLRGPVVLVDSG